MKASKYNNLNDLINGLYKEFSHDREGIDLIVKKLRNINIYGEDEIKEIWNIFGLSNMLFNIIYLYPSGRYKYKNRAKDLDKKIITNINYFDLFYPGKIDNYNNEYIESSNGFVIPFYFNGHQLFAEPESKYYLYAYKIFISQDTRRYSIEKLLEIVDDDTDIIYDSSNRYLYNLKDTNKIIKPYSQKKAMIGFAMKRLDEINQPYEKNYMFNDDWTINKLLLNLSINPKVIETLNTSLCTKTTPLCLDVHESAKPNMFEKMGLDICNLNPFTFYFDKNNKISEVDPFFGMGKMDSIEINNSIIQDIIDCDNEYVLTGFSIRHENYGHRTSLIFNTITGKGFVFDSSYSSKIDTSYAYLPAIENIVNRLDKYYPEIEILDISKIDCPLLYRFQETPGDFFCIGWSYYIGLLFLLNTDLTYEEIINHMYNIGKDMLFITLSRFLIWDSEEIEVKPVIKKKKNYIFELKK